MIDPGLGGRSLAPGDPHRVIEEQLFRFLVDLEVVKAQRLQYCVAVIAVAPDLPPAEAAALSLPRVLAALVRRTRATDVITRLASGSFALLLVDAEPAALGPILGRLRDELGTAAAAGAVAPTWSAGAACYPKSAGSPAELLRLSADLLARARDDGGDRMYIAS